MMTAEPPHDAFMLHLMPLIDGETAETFALFQARMQADLAPIGATEEWLARRVIQYAWRIERMPFMEALALEEDGKDGLASRVMQQRLAVILRLEAQLQRGLLQCLNGLRGAQRARARAQPTVTAEAPLDGATAGLAEMTAAWSRADAAAAPEAVVEPVVRAADAATVTRLNDAAEDGAPGITAVASPPAAGAPANPPPPLAQPVPLRQTPWHDHLVTTTALAQAFDALLAGQSTEALLAELHSHLPTPKDRGGGG